MLSPVLEIQIVQYQFLELFLSFESHVGIGVLVLSFHLSDELDCQLLWVAYMLVRAVNLLQMLIVEEVSLREVAFPRDLKLI